MTMPKTVLVSCGTAIATSTVVTIAIEDAMKERGIKIVTRQCKAMEIRSKIKGVDLVVTTTPVPDDLGVPVIQTLAFLTGMGKEEAIEQIAQALQ